MAGSINRGEDLARGAQRLQVGFGQTRWCGEILGTLVTALSLALRLRLGRQVICVRDLLGRHVHPTRRQRHD